MTVGVTQNFLPYWLGAKLPIDRGDVEGESEENRGIWGARVRGSGQCRVRPRDWLCSCKSTPTIGAKLSTPKR